MTAPMQDVQRDPADIDMSIDRVGVKGLTMPLIVRHKEKGIRHTVAKIDLSVDLPGSFKGTHMSRFIEALEGCEEFDYNSFKGLLTDIAHRLEAQSAHCRFSFPYFVRQESPSSGASAMMDYDCQVDGELKDGKLTFTLGADVPVMTVCPCSKAISEEGAHSQRAIVRVRCRFTGFLWLEDIIAIAEKSASSPVYSLLKREDEKYVTEAAFANPCFVEDVVRNCAHGLAEHEQIEWFRVEVESFESIHNHSAFAVIESN